MQEISNIQKIIVDSRRFTPRGPLLGSRRPGNLLFSLHGEREVEAHTALRGEGATQAPLTVSKVERIALKEGVGYSG
jgi:hypothetical protein